MTYTLHTAKMHHSPYNSATGQPSQDARMYQQTRPAGANPPPQQPQPQYNVAAGQQLRVNATMAGQPPRPGLPNPTSQPFVPNQPQPFDSNPPSRRPNQPPPHVRVASLSVTDMRGQILANALVAFPHIVHQNNQRCQPPDIFEISISLRDNLGTPDYTARLTHRHELAPALHDLLLGGAPKPTAPLALLDLLDTTCTMLGTDEMEIIGRPLGARSPEQGLHGSHEGDRNGEMKRAKECVTQLREEVRSQVEDRTAEVKEAARLKAEARAAEVEAHAAEISRLHTEIDAAERRVQNQKPSPEEEK
jgi:hypothetical protein